MAQNAEVTLGFAPNDGSGNGAILESEDYVPTDDTARHLALLPSLLFISFTIVFGTLGNSVVCYLYGYKLKLTVTKQFIFVMAIVDLVNCTICAPTELVLILKLVSFDHPVWCKISRFLTYSLNGSTSLILLAIAIDRYCKVCKPLKVFFNKLRGSKFCVFSVISPFALAWPSLVLYGTKRITSGVNGTTCLIQDDYEVTWYPFGFYTMFFVGFLAIAITVISLYVMIAKQIRILRRKQDERIRQSPVHVRLSACGDSPEISDSNVINADNLKEPAPNPFLRPPSPKGASPGLRLSQGLLREIHKRKTAYKPGKSTLMLFLVTIVFLVSFMPFFITAMVRGVMRQAFLPSLSYSEVIANAIFIRSYLLSAVANPIIYSFCNSQFRRECKKIFCKFSKKKTSVEIRVEHTDNTHSIL